MTRCSVNGGGDFSRHRIFSGTNLLKACIIQREFRCGKGELSGRLSSGEEILLAAERCLNEGFHICSGTGEISTSGLIDGMVGWPYNLFFRTFAVKWLGRTLELVHASTVMDGDKEKF